MGGTEARDLRRSRAGAFVSDAHINDPAHWRRRAEEARTPARRTDGRFRIKGHDAQHCPGLREVGEARRRTAKAFAVKLIQRARIFWMQQRSPNPRHRRALELLAASRDGCTEATMVAHGFTIEMMVDLVCDGLASAHVERVVAGNHTIEVAC